MRRALWILRRMASVLRRRRRDADINAELAFHLQSEVDDAMEAGLSPTAARRAARKNFGNLAVAREEMRDVWTWSWLEALGRDVRYAVRSLRRRAIFALTALLSLALGMGANIAVFSLADNMLRQLPVERPEELVRLGRPDNSLEAERYDTYARLRGHSRMLTGVIAMSRQFPKPSEVETEGGVRRAFVQMVSDDYFEVLGIRPWRGVLLQTLAPGAAREGHAVISYEYWQRQYSGKPDILGSRISVMGTEVFVSGVAPPRFRGTDIDFPIDVWVPYEYVVPADAATRTRGRSLQVMARLRPGETLTAAAAEASALLEQPVALHQGAIGFSRLRNALALPMVFLAAVTAFTLLVACCSLANLTTAGAVARDHEIVVRRAIGASTERVARLVAAETAVIVVGGTALAGIVAPGVSAALLAYLPPMYAQALGHLSFSFDHRVLGFGSALAVLMWFVLAVGPMLSAVRCRSLSDLRTSRAATQQNGRGSRGLIVASVAICTVLLTTSGMFVRTLLNLHGQNVGYAPEGVLVADLEFPEAYPASWRDLNLEALQRQAAHLPGVVVAAFSHYGQLSGYANEFPVSVPGVADHPSDADQPFPWEERVSPGFFAAMGTRLTMGREFTDADHEGSPDVAVVNQAFAARFFPGTDPIGKSFTRTWPLARVIRIVGVVEDGKWLNLREAPPVMYYVPHRQHPGAPSPRLVLRTEGDIETLAALLTRTARGIDPQMRLSNVAPFADIVERTLVIERLIAHVATWLAAFAIGISCIGLYGILAFAVVRRTREIGIRIALGAQQRAVEWLFLREATILLLAGFAFGLPAAYAVTRAVSSFLFGIEPGDPTTSVIVVTVLAATGLSAAWVPARGAARTDPVEALRLE